MRRTDIVRFVPLVGSPGWMQRWRAEQEQAKDLDLLAVMREAGMTITQSGPYIEEPRKGRRR